MAKTFEFKVRINTKDDVIEAKAYKQFKDWINREHHTSQGFGFNIEMVAYLGSKQ